MTRHAIDWTRGVARLSLLALLVGLGGCTLPIQRLPPEQWQSAPETNKALVYVVDAGGGLASGFSYLYLMDPSGSNDAYVGTLITNAYVALQLDPGKHRLGVMGETLDLIDLDLKSGEIYHAMVVSYLAPSIHGYDHFRFVAVNGPNARLDKALRRTGEVVPTDLGRQTAVKQKRRLDAMKSKYTTRWEVSPNKQRVDTPTRHPNPSP